MERERAKLAIPALCNKGQDLVPPKGIFILLPSYLGKGFLNPPPAIPSPIALLVPEQSPSPAARPQTGPIPHLKNLQKEKAE